MICKACYTSGALDGVFGHAWPHAFFLGELGDPCPWCAPLDPLAPWW